MQNEYGEELVSDWSVYANFKAEEFDCSKTKKNQMTVKALDFFQAVRTELGKSMVVTSGYRDRTHDREKTKANPGSHAQGTAADFRVGSRADRDEIEAVARRVAAERGIKLGLGLANTFIHLDVGHAFANRPGQWTYN